MLWKLTHAVHQTMHSFRHTAFFRGALKLAACLTVCCCAGFLTLLAHAAAPAAPQAARKVPSHKAARPGWNFQAPDRSAQNARWRESICDTLQRTTFATSAPAGRFLRHNATMSGKRLPPAQLDDLDKLRPPENTQNSPADKTRIQGEIAKDSTGWRPHDGFADTSGAAPALKEERRAGAYVDFHPSEDVELKFGPEYHLGATALRPEQTGKTGDTAGLGMGMRLKIDF